MRLKHPRRNMTANPEPPPTAPLPSIARPLEAGSAPPRRPTFLDNMSDADFQAFMAAGTNHSPTPASRPHTYDFRLDHPTPGVTLDHGVRIEQLPGRQEIDTFTGAGLNAVGRAVGLTRAGNVTDDAFRRLIIAWTDWLVDFGTDGAQAIARGERAGRPDPRETRRQIRRRDIFGV